MPTGTGWFHEVKYDGYRLRIERDAEVRSYPTTAFPTVVGTGVYFYPYDSTPLEE